ncbi:transcriptional regulator NrdR [Listeria monocytogenes]|nr:transcriptional regulator NrdR [Listeria monocytogenes]
MLLLSRVALFHERILLLLHLFSQLLKDSLLPFQK